MFWQFWKKMLWFFFEIILWGHRRNLHLPQISKFKLLHSDLGQKQILKCQNFIHGRNSVSSPSTGCLDYTAQHVPAFPRLLLCSKSQFEQSEQKSAAGPSLKGFREPITQPTGLELQIDTWAQQQESWKIWAEKKKTLMSPSLFFFFKYFKFHNWLSFFISSCACNTRHMTSTFSQ